MRAPRRPAAKSRPTTSSKTTRTQERFILDDDETATMCVIFYTCDGGGGATGNACSAALHITSTCRLSDCIMVFACANTALSRRPTAQPLPPTHHTTPDSAPHTLHNTCASLALVILYTADCNAVLAPTVSTKKPTPLLSNGILSTIFYIFPRWFRLITHATKERGRPRSPFSPSPPLSLPLLAHRPLPPSFSPSRSLTVSPGCVCVFAPAAAHYISRQHGQSGSRRGANGTPARPFDCRPPMF